MRHCLEPIHIVSILYDDHINRRVDTPGKCWLCQSCQYILTGMCRFVVCTLCTRWHAGCLFCIVFACVWTWCWSWCRSCHVRVKFWKLCSHGGVQTWRHAQAMRPSRWRTNTLFQRRCSDVGIMHRYATAPDALPLSILVWRHVWMVPHDHAGCDPGWHAGLAGCIFIIYLFLFYFYIFIWTITKGTTGISLECPPSFIKCCNTSWSTLAAIIFRNKRLLNFIKTIATKCCE